MPDTPEHPVTLGDLAVIDGPWSDEGRPATVADLVSVLRALVDQIALWLMDEAGQSLDGLIGSWGDELMDRYRAKANALLDALAEAQP